MERESNGQEQESSNFNLCKYQKIRNEMSLETVQKIDSIIRSNLWFDFHVVKYDGQLILGGSTDLTYYHKLEIIFEEVFFFSGFFQDWKSNTKEEVIKLPDENLRIKLNQKFEIELGYQIFVMVTEDYENDIYIAAKKISFNTDTVYYYYRENLLENERLADFIKAD
jgi:hypothetical protein